MASNYSVLQIVIFSLIGGLVLSIMISLCIYWKRVTRSSENSTKKRRRSYLGILNLESKNTNFPRCGDEQTLPTKDFLLSTWLQIIANKHCFKDMQTRKDSYILSICKTLKDKCFRDVKDVIEKFRCSLSRIVSVICHGIVILFTAFILKISFLKCNKNTVQVR